MEFRNLQTFVRSAELGSFTKAASELGYTQSTVTLHIQQLEQELQCRLFERIGKQIQITENGIQLLTLANQILKLSEDAHTISTASTLVHGTLRIGVVESIQNSILPSLIHQYHTAYPQVHLFVKAGDCQTLLELLQRNELDFIFLLSRRIRLASLISLWEKREDMWFVSSPSHPLAQRKHLTLDDILSVTFLQTEPTLSYGLAFNEYLAQHGKCMDSFLEIGNPSVILELIKNGDGISYLPRYVVEHEYAGGTIAKLDFQVPEIEMWRQILYHKNKWVTNAMRAFFELL